MSSKNIVIDKSSFIPDRYFSHKSYLVNGMDMYKDQGKVLPLINSVQHHIEITPPKDFRKPPSILPNIPPKGKKISYHSLLAVPPQKKKSTQKNRKVADNNGELFSQKGKEILVETTAEKPENEQQEDKEEKVKKKKKKASKEKEEKEVEEWDENEELEENDEKEQKAEKIVNSILKGFDLDDENDTKPVKEDRGLFRSKYMVEKSKELLRNLETPFEIYHRFADLRQGRERDSDDVVNNQEKLRKIIKKLDLTIEVGNKIRDNRILNQMKRLPLEYFQKARAAKRKSKIEEEINEENENERENEGPLPSPQIFLNLDDSQDGRKLRLHQTTMDTLNVSMVDSPEASSNPNILTKTSSLNKWKRLQSLPDHGSTFEMIKYEEQAFLSPLHKYIGNDDSNKASQNFSSKSILATRKENTVMEMIKKKIQEKKVAFLLENEKKKEIAAKETRKWAMNRVNLLGYTINNLKNNTIKDISLVKNYRKTLLEDTNKFDFDASSKKDGDRGDDDDEESDEDHHHYEDAIEINKKRLAKGRFMLNYSKVQLKSKRDRSVENIRFEKQMSKMEKKIIQKTRSKSTMFNIRRIQPNT